MVKNRDPLSNGRDLLLAVVVGVFGLGAVVLGIVKIGHDINAPFQKYANADEDDFELLTQAEEAQQEALEKQGMDTDGDGLNDYEEEYVYGTSPYLADSDSDGYSDKVEIDNNENPLCPAGEDCSTTYASDDTETTETEEVPATAEEIRAYLAENTDLDAETLDKFTDDELLALWEETSTEFGNPFEQTSTGSTVSTDTGYEDLDSTELTTLPGTDVAITDVSQVQDMTPEEIHDFLIALGLTEDDLEGVDDDVLKGLVVQLIAEQSGTASDTTAESTTEE